jgi:hypothetical protein
VGTADPAVPAVLTAASFLKVDYSRVVARTCRDTADEPEADLADAEDTAIVLKMFMRGKWDADRDAVLGALNLRGVQSGEWPKYVTRKGIQRTRVQLLERCWKNKRQECSAVFRDHFMVLYPAPAQTVEDGTFDEGELDAFEERAAEMVTVWPRRLWCHA